MGAFDLVVAYWFVWLLAVMLALWCDTLAQEFGCCGCGARTKDVMRRSLNTQYADDESNYLTSCRACFEDCWNYYEDLWADYYGGQGFRYSHNKPPRD